MKRLLFALLAVASVALGAGSTGAQAQVRREPAWCAFSSSSQGLMQCAYATLEQCRAFLGGQGYCERNPRATAFASMKRGAKQ